MRSFHGYADPRTKYSSGTIVFQWYMVCIQSILVVCTWLCWSEYKGGIWLCWSSCIVFWLWLMLDLHNITQLMKHSWRVNTVECSCNYEQFMNSLMNWQFCRTPTTLMNSWTNTKHAHECIHMHTDTTFLQCRCVLQVCMFVSVVASHVGVYCRYVCSWVWLPH